MTIVDWVFPSRCVGCGVDAPGLCDGCLARAPGAPATSLPVPRALDALVVPYVYEGAVRAAITHVKYRNDRAAVRRLADAAASALCGFDLAGAVVTWVPTTRDRRRGRGFDHAELLARAVARRTRQPSRRLLRRLDDRPQTGRSRLERTDGPSFAVPTGAPAPATVVVVDDVVTTGTSLDNAAGALRRHGCKTVIGAAVGLTLLKQVAARTEKPSGRGVATTDEPGSDKP